MMRLIKATGVNLSLSRQKKSQKKKMKKNEILNLGSSLLEKRKFLYTCISLLFFLNVCITYFTFRCNKTVVRYLSELTVAVPNVFYIIHFTQ